MPASHNNGFDLFYDSDKSTGVKRYGDMVMLEHTHVSAIEQLLVTGTENVNPFAVVRDVVLSLYHRKKIDG